MPDQKGIDRAEQQFAVVRAFAHTVDVVEYPFDLRGGKISVDQQAGLFTHELLMPGLTQFVAYGCRMAGLPDDGVVYRFAGVLVPDDGGFTLVRDADAGNFT